MSDPVKVELGHSWRSKLHGRDLTARADCKDSNNPGRWYCVTHDEAFVHNMAMHSHTGQQAKPCVIAWWCFEHGAEVP